MLRFSTMIGLPVISVQSGEKIAIVKDIIFDTQIKKILALAVHCKKVIFNHRIILMENIINIGTSAVLIKNSDGLISYDVLSQSRFKNAKKYMEEFIGTPVYSNNGMNIGDIQDISFDWEIGSLEELQVSDGIVQDIIEGLKIIPVAESIQLEQGIVMIDQQNINDLKYSGKGIKRLLAKGSKDDERK
ncbi:PRC-barrel domain-containing protein [Petroclostridium sp. X23]|uniref:PRC-barrel domain-containing protein n=1 Tax=Petroclostridium sp. X23 TaxID=3045146 RepID=UPI0024AD9DAD|nr:PRC-barrel domain-containing protein [Petroclostridium sp. X23]WHH59679.1 PRC-barrel domain-containing protein [Petroclostridium sp. X23]